MITSIEHVVGKNLDLGASFKNTVRVKFLRYFLNTQQK